MILAIVAKLVLNAAKNAFRRTAATDSAWGSIAVMARIENGSLMLRVGDDAGHEGGSAAEAGRGSAIIASLIRTLGADMRRLPTKRGTTVEIGIPMMT